MVDLACDWGEGFGPWTIGASAAILDCVSSVHLACGFHAGDPLTMADAVERCAAAGVTVGAHPGWPDLVGFGRRELACSAEETRALVLYQIGALAGIARSAKVELRHVKPHGALYNQAARDPTLADAVAAAVVAFNPELAIVTLPGSALERAAHTHGLGVLREFFADRRYRADGSLLSRRDPRAVLHDPATVVDRVLAAVKTGRVAAADGGEVEIAFETICIHGDTPHALELARAVRQALDHAGIPVGSPRAQGPR